MAGLTNNSPGCKPNGSRPIFLPICPRPPRSREPALQTCASRNAGGALGPIPALTGLVRGGLQYLAAFWAELKARGNQADYRSHGSYEDEKALLLFYRDRELELGNAVKCPTWSAMRQIPGVEDAPVFQSKFRSRLQATMHLRQLRTRYQGEGASLAGRAAMAEAERRLIVTAIALERYRVKYREYPQTVAKLSPEFLKNPPVDFMDGQPLRYHTTDDGHFILYAIGLDCVDHGGRNAAFRSARAKEAIRPPFGARTQADIVWRFRPRLRLRKRFGPARKRLKRSASTSLKTGWLRPSGTTLPGVKPMSNNCWRRPNRKIRWT